MQTNLLIVYETNLGRAVPLARIRNPGLLRSMARAAVCEKRAEVIRLGRLDSGLAAIAEGELQNMRHSLKQLVPGMRTV